MPLVFGDTVFGNVAAKKLQRKPQNSKIRDNFAARRLETTGPRGESALFAGLKDYKSATIFAGKIELKHSKASYFKTLADDAPVWISPKDLNGLARKDLLHVSEVELHTHNDERLKQCQLTGIEKLDCTGYWHSPKEGPDGLDHLVKNNLESLKTLISPPLRLLERLPPLTLDLLSVNDLPKSDDEQKKLLSAYRLKRFECHEFGGSNLTPPFTFWLQAEEIFIRGFFETAELPVSQTFGSSDPHVDALLKLFEIQAPSSAEENFIKADSHVNPLLKRFEVEAFDLAAFSLINMSKMLTRVAESFPNLEAFGVRLENERHTLQSCIAGGDFGSILNAIIKRVEEALNKFEKSPFHLKVDASCTVRAKFDPKEPFLPEGFELLEQSASLEETGRGKQLLQRKTDLGLTLQITVIYNDQLRPVYDDYDTGTYYGSSSYEGDSDYRWDFDDSSSPYYDDSDW